MRKTEPDLGDPSTRIALMHIGKTGGTTLTHRLLEVCEPNEMVANPIGLEHDGFGYMRRGDVERQLRTLPESVLKKFRIISGHLPFGFEDPLGLRFSYVSFFRSPVERILSGFMYGSQDQLKPNKEWLKFALHLSVSNGGAGFDNAVTRLLTGGEALIPSSSKATIWDLPRSRWPIVRLLSKAQAQVWFRRADRALRRFMRDIVRAAWQAVPTQ